MTPLHYSLCRELVSNDFGQLQKQIPLIFFDLTCRHCFFHEAQKFIDKLKMNSKEVREVQIIYFKIQHFVRFLLQVEIEKKNIEFFEIVRVDVK